MKRSVIKYLSGALAALTLFSCTQKNELPLELHSEADLVGLRVALTAGSSYDMDLSDRPGVTVQRYNSDSDVLQALLNGKADVAVTDEVVYNHQVQRENGIKIAFYGEKNFPTGFMFNKNNPALANTMTSILRRMEKDGSMEQLKDFWLTDRFLDEGNYSHLPAEHEGAPIRVGTCTMTAPVSFQINGEWYGIEIDLLRELGKELHRPLEINVYDVGAGIMAVKTGAIDVFCGCIFITPEREQEFLFSKHYHDYRPGYFVLDPEAKVNADKSKLQLVKSSVRKNLLTENRWK